MKGLYISGSVKASLVLLLLFALQGGDTQQACCKECSEVVSEEFDSSKIVCSASQKCGSECSYALLNLQMCTKSAGSTQSVFSLTLVSASDPGSDPFGEPQIIALTQRCYSCFKANNSAPCTIANVENSVHPIPALDIFFVIFAGILVLWNLRLTVKYYVLFGERPMGKTCFTFFHPEVAQLKIMESEIWVGGKLTGAEGRYVTCLHDCIKCIIPASDFKKMEKTMRVEDGHAWSPQSVGFYNRKITANPKHGQVALYFVGIVAPLISLAFQIAKLFPAGYSDLCQTFSCRKVTHNAVMTLSGIFFELLSIAGELATQNFSELSKARELGGKSGKQDSDTGSEGLEKRLLKIFPSLKESKAIQVLYYIGKKCSFLPPRQFLTLNSL